jgi:hypothetical protein
MSMPRSFFKLIPGNLARRNAPNKATEPVEPALIEPTPARKGGSNQAASRVACFRFEQEGSTPGGGLDGGDGAEDAGGLPTIPAGWPEDAGDGCVRLDPVAVLRATPRSFALRVRGQSMVNASICDGDIVVGEFTPEARPGAIVVALIDGESTLKRLVIRNGRPHLVSENPNCPTFVPLSELVIQGVVHTVVRRVDQLSAVSGQLSAR